MSATNAINFWESQVGKDAGIAQAPRSVVLDFLVCLQGIYIIFSDALFNLVINRRRFDRSLSNNHKRALDKCVKDILLIQSKIVQGSPNLQSQINEHHFIRCVAPKFNRAVNMCQSRRQWAFLGL